MTEGNTNELPDNLGEAFDAPDAEETVVTEPEPKKKVATKSPAKKAEGMPKTVRIQLEDNSDIPPTGLFVGHNGTGYLIKSGEPVDVPEFILEILDNAVMSLPIVDPSTQQVVTHRDRMRFPYRKL